MSGGVLARAMGPVKTLLVTYAPQTAGLQQWRLARYVRASIVGLLFVLVLVNFLDRIVMSIAAPAIIKEFHLSETQMGTVFSAFGVTYVALMIPGGHLADRFGARLVLTVVGLGSALFTGLTALSGRMGFSTVAGTVAILVVIRLGLGAFGSPIFPTCATMIANWIPSGNRALVYGLIAAGAPLGGAISPLLFSWMMVRYGWRTSFVQTGVATAILALAALWYLRDHPSRHPLVGERGARLLAGDKKPFSPQKRPPTPWRKLFTDHNLLLLASGYFTLGYFQYLLYYWTFYYFSEIRHMGRIASAFGTMSTFLAAMCMTPAGGWISDRLCQRYGEKRGRPIVPVIGLLSGALFLSLATRMNSPFPVFAMVSLALGLGSAAESPYWACAIHIGGREVGATCGIMNSSGNLGGLLAPVLTPLIASYLGWSWGLYAGCAIAALGVLIWFAVNPIRAIDVG